MGAGTLVPTPCYSADSALETHVVQEPGGAEGCDRPQGGLRAGETPRKWLSPLELGTRSDGAP